MWLGAGQERKRKRKRRRRRARCYGLEKKVERTTALYGCRKTSVHFLRIWSKVLLAKQHRWPLLLWDPRFEAWTDCTFLGLWKKEHCRLLSQFLWPPRYLVRPVGKRMMGRNALFQWDGWCGSGDFNEDVRDQEEKEIILANQYI